MRIYLDFNGKFLSADTPLIMAANRGFRYGDGLFETMKMNNGKIQLAAYHFERLLSGAALLEFEIPRWLTPAYLYERILDLCKKNQNGKTVRIRLMIFRGNASAEYAEDLYPNYIIESSNLSDSTNEYNVHGLVIDIYEEVRKQIDKFSALKSNNYLPSAMGAIYAGKKSLDDCLLLNSKGNICEATIANVFMVKDNIVYTPSLNEGCVAGIIRRCLLESVTGGAFKAVESSITVDEILTADEVFLTNSISGIRWVEQCGQKRYSNSLSRLIYNSVLKNVE